VAAMVTSQRPIAVGLSHACTPVSAPSIVTRAAGRTLLELDGRPADEVYAEKVGADLDEEELHRAAVRHPLAQPELSGEVRLRHVFGRAPGGGLAWRHGDPGQRRRGVHRADGGGDRGQ